MRARFSRRHMSRDERVARASLTARAGSMEWKVEPSWPGWVFVWVLVCLLAYLVFLEAKSTVVEFGRTPIPGEEFPPLGAYISSALALFWGFYLTRILFGVFRVHQAKGKPCGVAPVDASDER